uniref:Uncharacterized protein n=1 Tax=Mycena chlorophos TaxID=658473 RepID=A0ABQ0LYU0_MYCCL|nr:predicted protein [Mycena chlorophos]
MPAIPSGGSSSAADSDPPSGSSVANAHRMRRLRPLLPEPTARTQDELVPVPATSLATHGRHQRIKVDPKYIHSRAHDIENSAPSLPVGSLDTRRPATAHERRSAAQTRRRQREARERHENPPAHADSVNPKRSAAQQARHQRELATQILENLHIPQHGEERIHHSPAIAQSLRRMVERANRMLDQDPECDTTGALERALRAEDAANGGRRRYRTENWTQSMRRLMAERAFTG